ncbi:MAG: NAD(P)H-hydrate epimerase, partial [Propionibacteriaceae bacterium]|nr:NAD(P)H-hydrate epimerase [Propionibacteriaceae bacterium]
GELARLLGCERTDVTADPLGRALQASERFKAAVLLKGARQYSVAVDAAYVAVPGPAWTAQAGSGDVLAGVAGTLLAAGIDAALAGALAASLQAATAAKHLGPWAPDQLADWFPATISSMDDLQL